MNDKPVKLLSLTKSKASTNKKWMARFKLSDGSIDTVLFGGLGAKDFTLMHDENSEHYEPDKQKRYKIRENYLKRHAKNENWNDPLTPGALSRYLLWNRPTLEESVRDFMKKFNL